MLGWNNATLGEVIDHLSKLPPTHVVRQGFSCPHSYRGDYSELAFAPMENVSVADMLNAAESAVGKTYEGWKGGLFTMDRNTPCWLAEVGDTGLPIMLPNQEPWYELPQEGKG